MPCSASSAVVIVSFAIACTKIKGTEYFRSIYLLNYHFVWNNCINLTLIIITEHTFWNSVSKFFNVFVSHVANDFDPNQYNFFSIIQTCDFTERTCWTKWWIEHTRWKSLKPLFFFLPRIPSQHKSWMITTKAIQKWMKLAIAWNIIFEDSDIHNNCLYVIEISLFYSLNNMLRRQFCCYLI